MHQCTLAGADVPCMHQCTLAGADVSCMHQCTLAGADVSCMHQCTLAGTYTSCALAGGDVSYTLAKADSLLTHRVVEHKFLEGLHILWNENTQWPPRTSAVRRNVSEISHSYCIYWSIYLCNILLLFPSPLLPPFQCRVLARPFPKGIVPFGAPLGLPKNQ